MVLSTSKFHALSLRPPTPPKEDSEKEVDEVLDFLEDPFGTKPPAARIATRVIASKTLLSTPEQSPSSDGVIPSSSASTKKKVNFEPQPCTIPTNGLTVQPFAPLHSSPLRPLPQTRVSKPLKSILKPSDAASTPPPPDQGGPAHTYKSFAEMLESITKQLASPSRASRFDAYHSLQRTMQAYDKIPDMQTLLAKMGLLTHFIQRDMQAVSINGSGLDSQLVGQALKLLMALIRIPELRLAMDDEFCTFVVDRTVHVATDATMPKAIVNTHLATLMQQNFRPKTMTPARVEKILDALDTIHERVSGYSVLAYRIRIYRKLIQQKKDVMAKHTERWFRLTLKALLANQKDINQSALDTAISAAKAIGTDRQVNNSVLAILNRTKSDGDTFAKILAQELEKTLSSENATMVPQIWAAVTALLPGLLQKQKFPALADWLEVFEKCFNMKNDVVKVHANIAFGFLVYAVNLKEDTPSTWSTFLLDIPRQQLERRGQWKKPERQAATSAYFTLLYYSFGPMPSHKQLDRYWTEFIANFWNPLIHSSSSMHAFAACRVISALFSNARKHWDPQRALDLRPQAMVQREELPLLDPKWVRKSLSSILKFVETLLDATPWTVDDYKDEPAKTMWLSLLHSLKVAGSQEIMASTESKDAMAYIVNLLRRVWDRHTAQLALTQQKEDCWADKFCFLLGTIIEKLGSMQFSTKCLTRNERDEFEVAPTPSQRSRQHEPRISPLLYFVDLLINQSEGKLSDGVRLQALELLIQPCYESQNTRLSKLELLRDCSTVVDASSSAAVNSAFWVQVAGLTKVCLREQPSDFNERSKQLGKEYEVVVDILSLCPAYILKQSPGQEILVCLADTVRREAGDGALVLAVVEKVSEGILKRTAEAKTSCLPCLSILLRNLPKMVIRRTIEQGRQNLWPSSPNPGRNPEFDPYRYFYDAVVGIGSAAYRELDGNDSDMIREFLTAMADSIHHCNISLLSVFLRKVQEMIRLWVEDPDRKLQNRDQQTKVTQAKVVQLWKEVCAAIERLPRKDSQTLIHLQPLITAGFRSRRRVIVNTSITTWNATFGKELTLRYPAQLEQALQRLRNSVEISLPSLEAQKEDDGNEFSFYDSDNSMEDIKQQKQSPSVKESPFKIIKSTRKSRSPAISSTRNRRISTRQAPKVRLRHDNSQIQFEPIVSSPTDPFNQESQILTERQREMIERRENSANLFANLGRSSSPTPAEVTASIQSPLELHSDVLIGDEFPEKNSLTPLKSLPSLGPMDVFLGSSPTPPARHRVQEIVSDQTSVATPTAVRTVRRLDDTAEEIGSSPPRYEKDVESKRTTSDRNESTDDIVENSFGYKQFDKSLSTSFDDGTTIDDNVLVEDNNDTPLMDTEIVEDTLAHDVEASDMPSSTLDLQLTAQIDADMQAQIYATTNNQFLEASLEAEEASHQNANSLPSEMVKPESRISTEDEDMQITPSIQVDVTPDNGTCSTSRIGSSFSSQKVDIESPQIRSLRSSSRFIVASSPTQAGSAKKRKASSKRARGRPKRTKAEQPEEEDTPVPEPILDADGLLDNIIVASPKTKKVAEKKARRGSQTPLNKEVTSAETVRKRGIRRSASLLNQVEEHSEDLVEDTPAPKRARQNNGQDVSSAKPMSPKDSQSAQAKRLSHIQVTPKRSSEVDSTGRGSSNAVEESVVRQSACEPVLESAPVGEQKPSVAQQLPTNSRANCGTEQSLTPVLASASTPSRSFAERVILTPRSIINQLKNLKEALFRSSQLVLGRQEEREIDDALFEIRREVHAAGQRGDADE